MGLEAKLVQKLSQSLLMTPQLQQAIKLLQLGRLEFKEAIEKELLENPVLEETRDDGETPEGTKELVVENPESSKSDELPQPPGVEEGQKSLESSISWEAYLENLTDARGVSTPKGSIDHEDRPSIEATLTKEETLHDHIISQIRFSEIEECDQPILIQIIGNLDKDGYLCVSYEEIAESCGCTTEDITRVIEIIKDVDPPGVAARNLGECLFFQLEQQGLADTLEAKIVAKHLDKLEKRKYDQIAKLEQVAVDKVYKAVQAIQQLEPRPGRPYADENVRYIVPDIYVYKVGGEYVVSLNEDGLPKLRVSPYYLDLLKRKHAENVPNHEYLTSRLKAASWLIKSIHQRQQTIFRVTESIVKFQREFFDFGIEKLKPLVLKDVADDIGMHESTVSRVTTNKYVHTPQGVFELKYFFTTAIKTTGGDVSSSSIKERIKNMIAAESPSSPISDQEIVENLKKESVTIARRTVAKYREGLNIPSSAQRKRHF